VLIDTRLKLQWRPQIVVVIVVVIIVVVICSQLDPRCLKWIGARARARAGCAPPRAARRAPPPPLPPRARRRRRCRRASPPPRARRGGGTANSGRHQDPSDHCEYLAAQWLNGIAVLGPEVSYWQ
jgi:hypothetical protein